MATVVSVCCTYEGVSVRVAGSTQREFGAIREGVDSARPKKKQLNVEIGCYRATTAHL